MKLEVHPLLKVYITGGVASTACICCTLICTVIICPFLSHPHAGSVLSLLVALAVGCLTGDAIFHLIPHVFLSESSDHNPRHNVTTSSSSHHHSHVHEMATVWRALPIACAIYVFYFLHTLSETFQTNNEHGHSHLHSYVPEMHKVTVTPSENTMKNEQQIDTSTENNEDESTTRKSDEKHKTLPIIIWMIVIGDAVHTFCDGVAIGGAYATDFYGGLGTTIAIVFHEVPHCVGDFAVMLTTGLSHTQSFLLLLMVMCPTYLGMILGATLGQLMDLTRLIFAVTAGMFLFLALVEMLPRILKPKPDATCKWKAPILHSCGIILGMSIMFGIAILEGKLHT